MHKKIKKQKKDDILEGVQLSQSQKMLNYLEVSGIPSPQKDMVYIVNTIIRTALADRSDVVSLGKVFRDKDGRPKGNVGFFCNKKRK